jgi:high affinity Mn2+ porin
VVNQISRSSKLYLAAGGLAVSSATEAGPEQIIETYYSFAAFSFAKVTGDYQFVNNPACNRQRGPVSVFALHLHVEY